MKIFYIANVNLGSGKANVIQIVKMCEALARGEADMTLVVPFLGARPDIFSEYKLKTRFKIRRLPVFPFFAESRIGFNLRALSFCAISTLYAFVIKLLYKKITLYTIDLDQFSYFLLPRIAPTYIEMHGSKAVNIFLKSFFGCVSHVFAVSSSVKDSLIRVFKLPQERITVTPNGIDLDFFNLDVSKNVARKKLGLPEGKIFLYSGKFYDWKGLGTLIEAVKIKKDAKVYLIGGSSEELKKVLGVRELPLNVTCLGAKPFSVMPLYLISADYFLLTGTAHNKYSYYETSPMKLFEYMAIGRPIIACETPAVREVVDNSEVLFYEPDNAKDLSAKISYAISNENDMLERANKLKAKLKIYSIIERARKILEIINSNH